jgi:hypothetical protein
MDPEGSLPCSQDPTTGPNPEPDAFSPQPSKIFPKELDLLAHHNHKASDKKHTGT